MSRRTLVAGLISLALVAYGGWRWFLAPPGSQGDPAIEAPPALTPAQHGELVRKMEAQLADRRAVADPSTTGRTPQPPADERLWLLRIVDSRSREPVSAVRIVDVARAAEVGRSDADGKAQVQALPLARLAFACPGYLVKILQPGEADAELVQRRLDAGETARIELDRDEWTLPFELRFAAGGAAVEAPVRFVITCLDDPPPSGASFPRGRVLPGQPVAPEDMLAWQRHVLAQSLPALARTGTGSLTHLGVLSHDKVFVAADGRGIELRFAAPGRYRVDVVVAQGGSAGRADFRVDLQSPGPLTVDLEPGRFVIGVVVAADAAGATVADATVQLVESTAAAVRVVRTGADGRFGVGPVTGGGDEIVVTHPQFVDARLPATPGKPLRVTLTPRPRRVVSGVVRTRPRSAPIVGAKVLLLDLGTVTAEAVTGADGRFRLETGSETAELHVRSHGYLPYAEALRDEPVGGYVCDLVPATTEARVAAGMTGLVAGRVDDPQGKPAVGLPVQLFSDDAPSFQGIAGRVILHGGLPPLRPMAITDEQGRFSIEWSVAGPAKLLPTDGISGIEDAVPVSVVLGQRSDGHVLRTRD